MEVSIISGQNGWAQTFALFVNPGYISGPEGQPSPTPSAGFDISSGDAVVISFEGTYSGETVVHEQTLDITGAVGWFSVVGAPNSGGTATSSGSTTGTAYAFANTGVRHRIRISAMSSGTIVARILLVNDFSSAVTIFTSASTAVTIADGADVTLGAIANTAYDGSNATTAMGYLRAIANSALSTTPTSVAGGTASGSALTAAPVTVGGRGASANPTPVTTGQVVNAMFDPLGKLVSVGSLRALKQMQTTAAITDSTQTTVVSAGAAGVFQDVYGLILANSSANATSVAIKDVSSGTTRFTIEVPGTDTRGFMLSVDSAVPQATAASAWTVTCTGTPSIIATAFFVSNTA